MNRYLDAQNLHNPPRMEEQERVTYARKLKSARIASGLKQSEVAEQAGIARNTYAAMENGTTVPQADKLWAAMLVLDLHPSREDPEWLREWWAILRPLILQLPKETRGITMGRIVAVLNDALQYGEGQRGVGLRTITTDPSFEDFESMAIRDAALKPGYDAEDEIGAPDIP